MSLCLARKALGFRVAFSVDGYGFDTWRKLFTNRQLVDVNVRVCQGDN